MWQTRQCPSLPLQCKLANFDGQFLRFGPFSLTEPTLLVPWKAESAGELEHPKSIPQLMTDGRWYKYPVPSGLGTINQEYVLQWEKFHSSIVTASLMPHFLLAFLAAFWPVSLFSISLLVLSSPPKQLLCSSPLSQDQLLGEPKLRHMVMFYPSLASLPHSPASWLWVRE